MAAKIIICILLVIPLILAVIYLPKFFKTPNSKLNYIIMKYRLKTYRAEDLDNLLKQNDSEVPARDKEIIRQLLKDEYSL